jgi:hypothetical protein
MNEATPEKDKILVRIERLELQNRILKRGALAVLVGVTSIGLMAQAPKKSTRPATPKPAPAPAEAVLPKNIEAESFVLKDTNGKVRAELSMSGTGPSFKLRDQNGTALVTLSLNDDKPAGPYLLLSDPQQKAGMSISILEGAGSQLTMTGERADIQAHIGVAPDGTSMTLSDQDGFSTSIGNGIQPTKGSQVKKTSAASITLMNKDRKVLWTTP